MKITTTSNHHELPWFQGTVEEAFVDAKKSDKPIILYWGAIWCPPCNEIKAEVFSNPRFAKIVEPTIPVYLDGDTDRAQQWGEKLGVSGYPTLVMLSSDGKEMSRISGGVNIQEFESIVNETLATKKSVQDALKIATQTKADKSYYTMLAYVSWDQLPEVPTKTEADKIKDFKKLVANCPADLIKERALFAAKYLELNATAFFSKDDKLKALAESNRSDALAYSEILLKNHQTIVAGRWPIIYSTTEIVNWAWPTAGVQREKMKSRYLQANQELANDSKLSSDTRLWAAYPQISFQMKDNKSNSPSQTSKDIVVSAVDKADQSAKTEYERLSVISGAAYMLRQVGEFDKARELLTKELQTTKTPYYYQSSFANLEKQAGNTDKALQWSEKARLSASGRATKLQWLADDLLMNASLKSKNQTKKLTELTELYYQIAFELNDGFSGRNSSRAKAIATALKDWKKEPKIAQIISASKQKCSSMATKDEITANCKQHFESIQN